MAFVQEMIPESAEVLHLTYKNQTEELERAAHAHQQGKNVVVLFMGDPHFSGYQMIERLERACGHRVEILPGISAAQILASKTKVCFDETTFLTFHRRGDLEPFKRHYCTFWKISAMPLSSRTPGISCLQQSPVI